MSSKYYYLNDLPAFYKDVKIGDILQFPRGVYSHYGVYVGNYRGRIHGVVHFNAPDGETDVTTLFNISGSLSLTTDSSDKPKKNVKLHEIDDVISGKDQYVVINNSKDGIWEVFGADKIIARAGYYLDNPDEFGAYDLRINNCEHFANWLRYGKRCSGQVETCENVGAGLAAGAVVGLTLYAAKSLATKKEEKKESFYEWLFPPKKEEPKSLLGSLFSTKEEEPKGFFESWFPGKKEESKGWF